MKITINVGSVKITVETKDEAPVEVRGGALSGRFYHPEPNAEEVHKKATKTARKAESRRRLPDEEIAVVPLSSGKGRKMSSFNPLRGEALSVRMSETLEWIRLLTDKGEWVSTSDVIKEMGVDLSNRVRGDEIRHDMRRMTAQGILIRRMTGGGPKRAIWEYTTVKET